MLKVIVLAAGLSRRMGVENKLLMPFCGKTMVETTLDNILAAEIGEIVVVVGHEAEKVKAVLKNDPLSIIENLDYEKGMTTSIQTGVRATHNSKLITHNSAYMICLSDMVLIEPEEYQFLAEQFFEYLKQDKQAIVQPIFKGKRGNPVIFSHFYEKDILETTDTEGCRAVIQKYKKHVRFVEMPTDHVLQDVDFREDYDLLIKNINN